MLDAYSLTIIKWIITTEEEILDLDLKRTTLEGVVLQTQPVLIAIIIMEI